MSKFPILYSESKIRQHRQERAKRRYKIRLQLTGLEWSIWYYDDFEIIENRLLAEYQKKTKEEKNK